MLGWALTFLVVALIAAVLGFGGIAGLSIEIAKIIFFVAIVLFLIQNTQNRDTMALQLKLSELVLAMDNAENRVAGAEDLSDNELEVLHEELRARADATGEALTSRKASKNKKAS